MTDLAQFDTREKADAGVSFDLVIDGKVIKGSDKKPIKISIRGINAPDIQQYFMDSRKRDPAESPEDAQEEDMALLRLAVKDWSENFSYDGKPLPFSEENIEVLGSVPLIRGFIISKIMEVRGFIKGSSKGPP